MSITVRTRTKRTVLRALAAPVAFVSLVAMSGFSPVRAQTTPDPAVVGRWSAPVNIGVTGVHSVLLRTGKVLIWGGIEDNPGSEARLLDPVSGAMRDVSLQIARDIHCAGNSVLPDGRVLITGGEEFGFPRRRGIDDVTIFNPVTETWSNGPDMAVPRWYPTNVTMPDGSTLIISGWGLNKDIQQTMEVYRPATGITTLPASANSNSDPYPRMVLMPSGKVFRAGANRMGMLFDPATKSWSSVANMKYGWRHQGGVVLLPGLRKILTTGGNDTSLADSTPFDPGTATAETIALGQASPQWQYTGSMKRPRMHGNLVLLPDRTVLAVGGTKAGFDIDPVREAELYRPSTGTWSLMAAQTQMRNYHSTALLLPDGRVLSTGGWPANETMEYYSPPYLFKGARPTIGSAPASVGYGKSFSIGTPQAGQISRVALIRPGAVTHTTNIEQRIVELSFTRGSTSLTAKAPASAKVAPPGYYMLFIMNSKGVPAVAKFIRLP